MSSSSVNWRTATPSGDCSSVGTAEDDQYSLGGSSVASMCSSSIFPHPPDLYGRSSETLALLKAYQTVLQTRNSRTVLVHGESGSGKTALVDSLRKSVRASHGYFCGGKFFQNGTSLDPYSAIMAAFSDLCEQVYRREGSNKKRVSEIREQLETEGHLLSKSITGISPFLTAQLSYNREFDVRDESALGKFITACKTFLQSMTSGRYPAVLFLDDVQWMDDGSRMLLEELVKDRHSLPHLLLILTYRDEQEPQQVQELLLQAKCAQHQDILDLGLSTLSSEAVHQLITSLLGSSSDEIKALSDLIAGKTLGNPYHVRLFLEKLLDKDLLFYCISARLWFFDLDLIASEMAVSETVADLVTDKLENNSSKEMLTTLKVASLLGFSFSEDVLLEVVPLVLNLTSSDDEEKKVPSRVLGRGITFAEQVVLQSLEEAVKVGYLERTTGSARSLQSLHDYKFSHDKVQSTCLQLISADEETRLHRLLGDMFLSSSNDDDDCVHLAAVHMNQVPTALLNNEQKTQLAHINLRAATISTARSAFHDSANFLRRGLSLLDPGTKWSTHFDVAFNMTESLAQVDLIVGNFDECTTMANEALTRAKTMAMKSKSLVIQVEAEMAQNKMKESIASCNQALKLLGVKMPKRVRTRHVMLKLAKVKTMMHRRKTDEAILNLPPMKDVAKATAVKLLVNQCMYCLLKDEKDQGVYAALLATELTLKGGRSPYSASAMVIYGIAEITLGNHARGYRFGRLALQMLERYKCKDTECPTIGMALTSLLHWREPLRDLKEPFQQAMNSGFEVGNRIFGMFCVANCFALRVVLGQNLHSLERYMRDTYSRSCNLSRDAMNLWAQPPLQFVLNLKSYSTEWSDLTVLTGEIMEEDLYIGQVIEASHSVLMVLAWMYKSMLCYYMGDYATAASLYEDMAATGLVYHDTYGVISMHFFGAMTSFALYRETGNRKDVKMGRHHRKQLTKIAATGNPNASEYLVLLEAEEAALKPALGPTLVTTLYARAITVLETAGLVHMQALAHERLASALLDFGNQAMAGHHFHHAMSLYDDWGANAKYAQLKQKVDLFLCISNKEKKTKAGPMVGSVIEIDVSSVGCSTSIPHESV